MKQGVVFTKLAAGILIIAGLIILVFFVMKTTLTATKIAEDSECSTSIIAHSVLLRTTGSAFISDISCPTKKYDISPRSQDDVKQALAESLRTCWSTWGRGELALFKDDATYCHVCSIINFKGSSMKVSGMAEYLADTEMPNAKEPMTYAEYLKYYATSDADATVRDRFTSLGQNIEIDTTKPYAAVFLYAKGDNSIKNLLDSLGGGYGSTVGGIVAGGAAGTAAGVLTALAFSLGPAGWLTAITVTTAVGAGSGAVYGWLQENNAQYLALTMLTEYDSESISRLKCGELPVASS